MTTPSAALPLPWLAGRPAPATSDAVPAVAAPALRTFALLWAVAALAHIAAWPDVVFDAKGILIGAPALLVLASGGRTGALLALAAATLLQVAWAGPANVSNHWMLAGLVNLALLASAARLAWRAPAGAPRLDAGALFLAFAPTARLLLLVLYLYAVLHKLNLDFLDPAWSCATNHYASIGRSLPFLPRHPLALQATIWGALATEAAIPVLLVLRRTRVVGIALAMLFHMTLALNPAHTFFDFSSTLFALYFLFLPADFRPAAGASTAPPATGVAAGRAPAGARTDRWRAAPWTVCALLLAGLVAGTLLGGGELRDAEFAPVREGMRLAWLTAALGLLAVYLRAALRRPLAAEVRGADRLRPASAWGWVLPAYLLFHGASPYLGLKTEGSLAMFSNLRTEGERWNHAFLPPALKRWHFQDDLVTVRASSARGLAALARSGERYPYFTFRSLTAAVPQASLVYERGGRLHTLARVADDPQLATRPPRWQRWFLRFRSVPPVGQRTTCRH